MAPPYRRPAPDPNAPPRVGGYVWFRKRGGQRKRGLIRWIFPHGEMRVRPENGFETLITPADIKRAAADA